MRRRFALVAGLCLGTAHGGMSGLAVAETLPTGQSSRLPRQSAPHYSQVLSVYSSDEMGVIVLAFRTGRKGDALDLIDEKGWVGRLLIEDRIEVRGCGHTPYLALRARYLGRPLRDVSGRSLALGPAQSAGIRVRILDRAEVGDAPAGSSGLLAIDTDGDGRADLAHYVPQSCGVRGDEHAICSETWSRAAESWRRLERVEFPSCE